jgi:hypothetical protein
MKKRRRLKKTVKPLGGELPAWPDMHRFKPGLSTVEAFKINAEFQEWALKDPRFMEEWRNRPRCEVEFIL